MPTEISPGIVGIAHAGVLVSDLAVACRFYQTVLGLTRLSGRPELPYPGEWYALGGGQQLHLMCLPNPDAASLRPAHGGRDRHIAFGIVSLDALLARLDAAGVIYTLSMSGRRALFCRDPDGNTFEFIEI
jgi:glyoxylase I family protein